MRANWGAGQDQRALAQAHAEPYLSSCLGLCRFETWRPASRMSGYRVEQKSPVRDQTGANDTRNGYFQVDSRKPVIDPTRY